MGREPVVRMGRAAAPKQLWAAGISAHWPFNYFPFFEYDQIHSNF
jgi:hypothetical protein